jgi:glucose uptake protein GlcU
MRTYDTARGFAISAVAFFVCTFVAQRLIPEYWFGAGFVLAVTFATASMFDSKTPPIRAVAITLASAGAAISLVAGWYVLRLDRQEVVAILTGILVALFGGAVYAYLRNGPYRKDEP